VASEKAGKRKIDGRNGMPKRLKDVIRELSPEQLTGLDASFFYAETPRTPMHIGAFAIYDPSTAEGEFVRFKDILRHVEARLHRSKTFRRKLLIPALGVDHPYWMDDPEFDVEFHIRHIALPSPGDWRQLCIQVARLHARPLDMSKPLWEFTVIEGLDNIPNIPKGSFALVSKVHHAAIDGQSGVEMSKALHSLEPDEDVEAPDRPWTPGRRPSQAELLARAQWHAVTRPFHTFDVGRRMAPGALKFAAGLTRGDIKLLGARPPRTRFNGIVSGHRVTEAVTFDLDSLKQIRQRIPGVTVNDVMLAVVGGALRKYLTNHSELPHDSLIAMAPVSVRADTEKTAMGNQVSALSVPLGTHIAEPLQRLHFTHESANNQKAMSNAIGARQLADASKLAPAMITGVAARLYSRLGLANRIAPMFNTVVTNVPGPQVPLYFAGARMVNSFGIGPVMDSMGLFHAVTSYCGTISVTVTACRKMMPDPAFYADCLQSSFDELYAAATERKEKKRDKAEKREAAPKTDDLTLIKGLGPKNARKLNEAGIARFAELAALTEREIAALDDALKLGGRIAKEGWVEQAKALAAEGRMH
jgi:WS/DGAT/MGAT family acyltransferase